MTWEETIIHLRSQPEFRSILFESYLEEDLVKNSERFLASLEFAATLELVKQYIPEAITLLDIGAGNGISSVAFSRSGFTVTALEPDPSATVGTGAIQKLRLHYSLQDLEIVQGYGEELPFSDNSFDIVYLRQAMHHAADLTRLIAESTRVLKKGGILLTVRDHVIFDTADKDWFLNTHPLQKFYGGENAFKVQDYTGAMESAGLRILRKIRPFESVLNFAPMTSTEIKQLPKKMANDLAERVKEKWGKLGKLALIQYLYRKAVEWKFGGPYDERRIPGRLYSFVARK